MLQQPGGVNALLSGIDEPSAAPAARSHGVELRSGDIIVSRGGYPTSALIARGNDYPGNFSHVALVYIDSTTHVISVIEAHIELGVAISSFDKYLSDKKLRLMLLRLRADLPRNPRRSAPAAARGRGNVRPREQRPHPVRFRDGLSRSIAPLLVPGRVIRLSRAGRGVVEWHLDDLEPRPAPVAGVLRRVALRDGGTVGPRVRSAARGGRGVARYGGAVQRSHRQCGDECDAEGAERGDALTFAWYKLPPARLAKAYQSAAGAGRASGPMPRRE